MRHLKSLTRRAIILLLVVWTVVSAVTLLIELVPGDPAYAILGDQARPEQIAQFRRTHGLDRPAFFFSLIRNEEGWRLVWHGANNRYVEYWSGLLHGDMGRSFRTDRPVSELILQRYPATIELAIAALLVAIAISVPLGVIAGSRRGTWIDNLLSVIALIGISLPSFVTGPLLIYIFAVRLGLLAPSGRFDWTDIILPSLTLGTALAAFLTRMVRSSVIEELNQDYVRTARAKGLSERAVLYKHVLKNGLIPVVTVLGLQLGVLLAGAIITEKIFNWPGIGLLLVEEGINKRDYRVVQGCVLVISLTYIFANAATDMLYRLLDPRIRSR
ncbi:ABC transporter permease [Pyrinomonas methylaliphatogenes]|uniref:ABC-type dipeptide/oligopeptide/nickel transport system, permease component n=1 Tax=Pyrinomonas methylaliphatogenes TaxID=454194 RepID=A0A0B6WYF1_9BACT|nr:ABC transporter permease [Pyrinomonas methylaliphatogenes]CDM65334.1 ABC-type dipeptide/oligopeptide/nickel transport system, permease component [Pyrinomonas methylaliphatogenes]